MFKLRKNVVQRNNDIVSRSECIQVPTSFVQFCCKGIHYEGKPGVTGYVIPGFFALTGAAYVVVRSGQMGGFKRQK